MWLGGKVGRWEGEINTLKRVVHWHTQSEYSIMQRPLQQDLDIFFNITPTVGVEYQLAEKSLWRDFLRALFYIAEITMPI